MTVSVQPIIGTAHLFIIQKKYFNTFFSAIVVLLAFSANGV